MVAGFLYLVAEKSLSWNMLSFNRCELIIQLGEAYRCFAGKGDARHSSRTRPAARKGGGLFA